VLAQRAYERDKNMNSEYDAMRAAPSIDVYIKHTNTPARTHTTLKYLKRKEIIQNNTQM